MAGVKGIANFSEQIVGILKNYTGKVSQKVYCEARDCAKGLKKQLNWSSPQMLGDYKKGWSVKETKSGNLASFVVHNKTEYQLTHLLEKGHKGPRASSRSTKAHVHIQPLADAWVKEFEHRCEEACKEK